MSEVDLSRLLGGKSFTVQCTLSRNGCGVNTTALADSGANAFALLDTRCAKKISEFLNTLVETLEKPVPVKGYNGQVGKPITSILRIHLRVNGRRQYNVPFLVTDLGNHDVILGRKWLAYLDLWLDVRNRQLIWPATLPPTPSFIKEITVDMTTLLRPVMDPTHQADVIQRDQAFEDAIRQGKIRILKRHQAATVVDNCSYQARTATVSQEATQFAASQEITTIPGLTLTDRKTWRPALATRHSERINQRDSLQKMERELQGKAIPTPPARAVKKILARFAPVDIYCIGAVGFHRTLSKSDAQPFVTSLYEIDRVIEEKEMEAIRKDAAQDELSNEELINQKLPRQYSRFRDDFSKAASDVLPPHREYDLRIDLEKGTEHSLGFSPLYHYSAEELRTCKQYLVENLSKGFIIQSQSPFAAPILFARKADGSLRFCVDYRKLNDLTRKDRYPLPLLDETLARISKAKVFTKLDIRQAFHRIRIDPASEDLTTFRTRYGCYKYKVVPFGLTNGPATYQRYMNDVLFDYLDDFCTAYLDDILIYSENELEHQEHVCKVLERLRKAGLQADIRKSEFSVKRTKYLGFIISTDGIETDLEKTFVID
jgi:hypothetical protein